MGVQAQVLMKFFVMLGKIFRLKKDKIRFYLDQVDQKCNPNLLIFVKLFELDVVLDENSVLFNILNQIEFAGEDK